MGRGALLARCAFGSARAALALLGTFPPPTGAVTAHLARSGDLLWPAPWDARRGEEGSDQPRRRRDGNHGAPPDRLSSTSSAGRSSSSSRARRPPTGDGQDVRLMLNAQDLPVRGRPGRAGVTASGPELVGRGRRTGGAQCPGGRPGRPGRARRRAAMPRHASSGAPARPVFAKRAGRFFATSAAYSAQRDRRDCAHLPPRDTVQTTATRLPMTTPSRSAWRRSRRPSAAMVPEKSAGCRRGQLPCGRRTRPWYVEWYRSAPRRPVRHGATRRGSAMEDARAASSPRSRPATARPLPATTAVGWAVDCLTGALRGRRPSVEARAPVGALGRRPQRSGARMRFEANRGRAGDPRRMTRATAESRSPRHAPRLVAAECPRLAAHPWPW